MDSLNDLLTQRYQDDRVAGLTLGQLTEPDSIEAARSLVAIFEHDVKEGGFSQLIYNSNGAYLIELLEVLSNLGADTAVEAMDAALNQCLNNEKLYQKFINSPFKANFLTKKLDIVTSHYQAKALPLTEESEAALLGLFSEDESDQSEDEE